MIGMISVELRKIIIADREKGISVEEIHKILGVSIPAIYDIVRKYKEREHWKETIQEDQQK